MKKYLVLCLIGIFLLVMGCTSIEPKDEDGPNLKISKDSYDVLLKQVKAGDKNVNFTSLRMSFCETEFYNPHEMHLDEKKQMNIAIQKKEYKQAISIADKILEKDYLDIESHFTCMIAYKELGDTEKFEFHSYVADGLVNSILNSGDGKSFETAYKVINIREEYIALNILGYKQKEQCCVEHYGHRFDVLTVENMTTKKEEKLYFNIDLPFGDK